MESRARLRGPARIHCIQALRDCIMLLPVEELRNRRDVQFTSRNPEAAGGGFRPTENVVGYRDCGFHASSITRVIPAGNYPPKGPLRTYARPRSTNLPRNTPWHLTPTCYNAGLHHQNGARCSCSYL